MAAVAAVRSITSWGVHCFTAAMVSPTSGRYDGSFVRPRCGTGARNGLSVSTSSRSSGHLVAASRTSCRVLERHDPAERDEHAGAQATIDLVWTTGEAVQHGVLGDALRGEDVEDVHPHVARVDDEGETVRVRQRDLRGKGRALRLRGECS